MIIDQLPNLASVQETDEIPVERGTTTYKTTLQKLKNLITSLLTKADIGLGNVANERQYSAQNPPPYPVTRVDGKAGAVSVLPIGGSAGQVLKKSSDTDYDVKWDDESGVSKFATELSNVDLNNYHTSGFYYIRTGVAHAPSDWCWCIVCNGSGTMQMCIIANRIYVRCYTGSPLAWTIWRSLVLS